jgi:hypothetical protein
MNNKIIEELKRNVNLEIQNNNKRDEAIKNNPNILKTNKFLDKNVIQSENYLIQAKNFILNEIREISDQSIALFILERLSESQIKTLYNYYNDFKINLTQLKLPIDKSGFLQFLFTWLKKYNISKFDEINIKQGLEEQENLPDEYVEISEPDSDDDSEINDNKNIDEEELIRKIYAELEKKLKTEIIEDLGVEKMKEMSINVADYIINNDENENTVINDAIKQIISNHKNKKKQEKETDDNEEPIKNIDTVIADDPKISELTYKIRYLTDINLDPLLQKILPDSKILDINSEILQTTIESIKKGLKRENEDTFIINQIRAQGDNILKNIPKEQQLNQKDEKVLREQIKKETNIKKKILTEFDKNLIPELKNKGLYFIHDEIKELMKNIIKTKESSKKFNEVEYIREYAQSLNESYEKQKNDSKNIDESIEKSKTEKKTDEKTKEKSTDKAQDKSVDKTVDKLIKIVDDEVKEKSKTEKMTKEETNQYKKERIENIKTQIKESDDDEVADTWKEVDDDESLYFDTESEKNLKDQYKELFAMGDAINQNVDDELGDIFVKDYYEYIDKFSKVYPDKKKINNEKKKLKDRFKDEDVKDIMLSKIKAYKPKKIRKKTKEELEADRIRGAFGDKPIETKGKGLLEPIRLRIGRGLREFNEQKISKFYIDMKKFNNHNTLSLKYTSNHNVHPKLKPRLMSKNFKNVMLKIFDEKDTKEDIQNLTKDEQLYLSKLSKIIDIKNYINDDLEDEFQEKYETLRGILDSGNNNPDIIKQMKHLIFSAVNNSIISQKEAYAYLSEISLL